MRRNRDKSLKLAGAPIEFTPITNKNHRPRNQGKFLRDDQLETPSKPNTPKSILKQPPPPPPTDEVDDDDELEVIVGIRDALLEAVNKLNVLIEKRTKSPPKEKQPVRIVTEEEPSTRVVLDDEGDYEIERLQERLHQISGFLAKFEERLDGV